MRYRVGNGNSTHPGTLGDIRGRDRPVTAGRDDASGRRPRRRQVDDDHPAQRVGPADSRFASLRSDEVNVRTGPGSRYPIEWVFKRKAMPVEIVAEFENWRKIRDWQGASGWVHQSLLSGKRSFIVSSKAASLHKTPATSAEIVAKLEPEVMGEIRSCTGDWCRVRVSNVSGWIQRTGMWGVYKSEPIN